MSVPLDRGAEGLGPAVDPRAAAIDRLADWAFRVVQFSMPSYVVREAPEEPAVMAGLATQLGITIGEVSERIEQQGIERYISRRMRSERTGLAKTAIAGALAAVEDGAG